MTEQEILEGNNLIAQFMGYIQEETIDEGWLMWKRNKQDAISFRTLTFEKNWNELMPVLDRIESLTAEDGRGVVNFVVTQDSVYCVISQGGEAIIADYQGETRIECTYGAILKFIKWHNQDPTHQ